MSNSESNRVTMSILIVLPKATTSILGSSAIVDKIAWVFRPHLSYQHYCVYSSRSASHRLIRAHNLLKQQVIVARTIVAVDRHNGSDYALDYIHYYSL